MKFYSIEELIEYKAAQRKQIISNNILCPQYKMIMYGKGGLYKSLLSLHTMVTIANGGRWFGFQTTKCKTAFMTAEGALEDLQDRTVDYCDGMKINYKQLKESCRLTVERDTKLDRGYGANLLEANLLAPFHPEVVIIDPIYAVTSGRMTDEYDVRKFIDEMNRLITTYNFALILIHHTRKDVIADGEVVECDEDDLMGSVVWRNWCDTIVKVHSTDRTETDGIIRMSFSKARNVRSKIIPFEIQIKSEPLRVIRPDLEVFDPSTIPLFRKQQQQAPKPADK